MLWRAWTAPTGSSSTPSERAAPSLQRELSSFECPQCGTSCVAELQLELTVVRCENCRAVFAVRSDDDPDDNRGQDGEPTHLVAPVEEEDQMIDASDAASSCEMVDDRDADPTGLDLDAAVRPEHFGHEPVRA